MLPIDANGNLTADGTRTFEWDARNQLVAVTVGTHRSELTYDGLQRRVRIVEKENGVTQSDTNVVWCEKQICEERAADGVTVTRRAFAQGEQIAGTARFFATDHLGSVTEVTDATVTLLARYAFDPWGRRTVTGADATTVGFTGHQSIGTTSLSLSLYRAYDPDLGRWISEDPLKFADGPNTLAYVQNNPTGAADPLGLSAKIRCEIISGKGWGMDVGFRIANARHCYLDVDCPGKYHVSLEIYGPGPGFPNGKPMNQPDNPGRDRNTTWRPLKDCPQNCDFEDGLLRSFQRESRNLPPYDAMGPNSNTFVSEVVRGAGGNPTFPGGAYGNDYRR